MFLSQELGVHGVAFALQSHEHSAAHLGARTEAFVRGLVTRLEEIPDVSLLLLRRCARKLICVAVYRRGL